MQTQQHSETNLKKNKLTLKMFQEICIGILGNMACDSEVCVTMSENEKVR